MELQGNVPANKYAAIRDHRAEFDALRAAAVLNYDRSLVLEVLSTKASNATNCAELAMS